MPAISVTDLSVGYKNSPVVSGINLQLNTGRIICLLGPNGAGKTTLMKTLLGRIKPVSGHIRYDQTDISEMSAAIDHPSYFPYLSGKQNVQVVAAFWGLDVDPESALDSVGIVRAAHGRKAKDYSTGMKERLELCLALLSRPRFLFLDEPQNGLDPDGMISLSATLRRYRDEGNCVVISTHLLHEIQGVPDECVVVRNGKALHIPDLNGVNLADLYHRGRTMRITSAIRALLTYYWNIWYFLAAILGSMASLFLGAWISSEASGTPITGGYSFFFTGTQPLISLALLFILDARVSKVHYGGLPQQVYLAWLPSVLRTICRTLSIVLVNLLSVLLFDLTMVLSGSKMHSGLATLLCFLTFQSILIALIYSTLESLSKPPTAAVISGVLLYFWIVLPGNLADNATPYISNALHSVGLNLNGTAISFVDIQEQSNFGFSALIPVPILIITYVLVARFRSKGAVRK